VIVVTCPACGPIVEMLWDVPGAATAARPAIKRVIVERDAG
jgi:sarcosine oxidase delta subunit